MTFSLLVAAAVYGQGALHPEGALDNYVDINIIDACQINLPSLSKPP
jgi:hypothetical protein